MEQQLKAIRIIAYFLAALTFGTNYVQAQCDSTELIVNGSFETGLLTPSLTNLPNGEFAITGNANIWGCVGVPQHGINFMIIDGFPTNPNNSGTDRVWYQTISNLTVGQH